MEMFVAVFLLALAGQPVGSFGTVMDPRPVPQAVCEKAVADPDVRQRVADFIKEHTGEDVTVKGLCQAADADEDEDDSK